MAQQTTHRPAVGTPGESRVAQPEPVGWGGMWPYLLLGVVFGIFLTKSEVISWFRIQEMFRFQSFHMYGIIASALLVSGGSLALIRKVGLKTLGGEEIVIPPKEMGRGYRYSIGGVAFGCGWALTGACPGPLFALLGQGVGVIAATIVSAVAGAWAYGALRPRLPH